MTPRPPRLSTWVYIMAILMSARPCKYGRNGTKHGTGSGRPDVMTDARSGYSVGQGISVYHVRDLGDGDAPMSLKDTRLLAVACRPMLVICTT